MLIQGTVKRVVTRQNQNGGSSVSLDILDDSAGRVTVTHYPEVGGLQVVEGQRVECEIGQVRGWKSERGSVGVNLMADEIRVLNS